MPIILTGCIFKLFEVFFGEAPFVRIMVYGAKKFYISIRIQISRIKQDGLRYAWFAISQLALHILMGLLT